MGFIDFLGFASYESIGFGSLVYYCVDIIFSISVNKRRDSSNSLFLFGTETIRFDHLFIAKLLLFSQFLSIGGT